MSLADLETRLAQDLAFLNLPASPWVPPRDGVLDVLIVGGGMCGLAALAQLRFLGIDNSFAIDAAAEGFEGPWETFARMRTLRSPKSLTGPALDQPSLTFRAWFTAQWGAAAWDALDKIPKPQWMEYLRWYRRVLALPVRNETRLRDLRGEGTLLRVTMNGPEGPAQLLARRVVLATGRSGLGGGAVPSPLRGLDPRYWAHSADDIDFSQLRGREVAVIGAGASAFDNAAVALEAGAARVDLLIRRASIPAVNKLTGIASPGTELGLGHLPDDWKLQIHGYAAAQQVPPPRHSVRRVSAHDNAYFHLDCALTGVTPAGDRVKIETSRGQFESDFVIAGTGFRNDFSDRAELSQIAPHVLSWADRPGFPLSQRNSNFGQSPYLAPDFSFIEKQPGMCPALAQIHCFNDAAMLSHGKVSGDIPAVSVGAKRLARAIARAFFAEDIEVHFDRLRAYDTPELHGDEYLPADHLPNRA
ncbi:NAD(P)/FAD-dependent oxidoreductase [Pseudooceanicola sediminis]|uniref:NAD(P)/FAD-dependent oxidoreductase n=1 Tax=Pseudooceanicola sediminis TaxID=2211117 RepID=A0A399IYX3_9RHOB|nr:NAD(P)/FAD-dependent oxidoreductase [Pseudooceanicola sediminis]KAA2312420.1 NAD(P)/FAD-dependent oxidoreductase [Puniceibacterium sp. HSS470]RII37469.1 NAD(P)/FAD-dependent oxidoreductase [Pseudooceanicola sediminis]|tara:strand:+ start:16956 stop:18374 length:1419 start_codon:yes stop_codon:yes gene_type:complete